ncbi:hypothetical protein N7494_012830 [Penicillium frequentans]|uniref:Uncharacterized protein n=1 Tax=Penicillium frequentans TaxID=3151616 RepID=A0AAD6CML2_9EURO|nr:hypothetical protein N7494_012830 [Penicillium glabrum]
MRRRLLVRDAASDSHGGCRDGQHDIKPGNKLRPRGVNGRAGNKNELIGENSIVMGNMMETRSKNERALV